MPISPENQARINALIQETKNSKSSILDLSVIASPSTKKPDKNEVYRLEEIPDQIFELKQLKELNLNFHSISKISDRILELENLEVLKIAANNLKDLPSVLKRLKNLKFLDVSFNGIQASEKGFSELQQLSTLDISGLKINKLPDSIFELENLVFLDCSFNQITFIPNSIKKLQNLKYLDLQRNKIEKFPKAILNLYKLEVLELSSNNLENIPTEFSNLTSLKHLDLSFNKLKSLPESIVNLNNLESIILRNNRFDDIPDFFYEIKSLKSLNFNNLNSNNSEGAQNIIKEISPKILQLENLENIILFGNPVVIPPMEIVAQGIQAIKNYFQQIQQQGEDFLYEAKLLIVGEGGAGKTTLAKKILDSTFQLIDSEKSTEGIEVSKFIFKTNNDKDFRLNIWDFGGQEIYHATHQFFLTKRSLYILVADTRKEDTDFYYWLNVVELLSGSSPLLIVKNEKQDRHREINERQLRGQFTNFKATLSTNLANNRGLSEIISEIKHYISSLPHIGSPLPKNWIKVREKLETHPENYISIGEYFNTCQENGFSNKEDKLQLLEYLHDLGVCLHFHKDPLLKRIVILKPKWGTDAVYKVLDNRTVINNLGRFTKDDLEKIWYEPEYEGMQAELLQLMINFKICYKIPNCDLYIAPQMLSENQCSYNWDETNNFIIRYEYEFMPKGIITQLIVVMHQMIEDQNKVWKSGVVLKKGNARAEVIEFYSKREIKIRTWGSGKKDLSSIIAYELDKINSTYNRIKYNKLIPCACGRCKNNQEPYFYKLEILIQFYSDGQKQIQCQKSYEMVDVMTLIGYGVTTSDQIQMMGDVFKQLVLKDIHGQVIIQAPGSIGNIDNTTQKTISGNLISQRSGSGDNIVTYSKNKDVKVKSAWANGSFYLFTFAVVIAGLGVLSNSVSPYTLPMILIAGIIFVPTIGALQLKQDERLSDKTFIELMKLTTKQLPLIGSLRKQIEPPSDNN